MLTIGLIGGIASGKSTVSALLAEHGACVIDADRLAREALQSDAVKDQLVQRWGEAILDEDGSVDRGAVAQKVFGDSPEATAERGFLEGLTHPEVRRKMREELRACADAGRRVAVLDVPLLLEVGWQQDCDLVLMVDSSQSVRSARAKQRGWTSEQFASREASQLPIAQKRAAADFLLSNDADLPALRLQIARFWSGEVAPRLAGTTRET